MKRILLLLVLVSLWTPSGAWAGAWKFWFTLPACHQESTMWPNPTCYEDPFLSNCHRCDRTLSLSGEPGKTKFIVNARKSKPPYKVIFSTGEMLMEGPTCCSYDLYELLSPGGTQVATHYPLIEVIIFAASKPWISCNIHDLQGEHEYQILPMLKGGGN